MAIADTINLMKTYITYAYNAIRAKGGTVPTNKNLAYLSRAIYSIPRGGIENVSTVAELKAKVTAENVDKFYKYTGASSSGFESYELYCVVENSGGGYNVLGLGKVTYNTTKYTVTYNYTACGDDAGSPVTNMPLGGTITIDVYTGVGPYADYVLPDTITVTGCQYTWILSSTKKNGTLTLYNATGNITVTIVATTLLAPLTRNEVWNFFGDCNVRDRSNGTNVFEDVSYVDDFIILYSENCGQSLTEWEEFKDYFSKAASIASDATINMTEAVYDTIKNLITYAAKVVGLSVGYFPSMAADVIAGGFILTNFYDNTGLAVRVYLWLAPAKPYAPLD